MLDDRDEKKRGQVITFDINKWLPYILILGTWLIGYGRDSSGTEALRTQVTADRAVIQAISDKLGTVSDRLARVEATLDSMKREQDQDRAYIRNSK